VGDGAWLGVGDVVGVDGDEQEGEAAAREATLKKAPARTARRAQPNKARNAAEASTSGSIGMGKMGNLGDKKFGHLKKLSGFPKIVQICFFALLFSQKKRLLLLSQKKGLCLQHRRAETTSSVGGAHGCLLQRISGAHYASA
jgi:hypothetical protein